MSTRAFGARVQRNIDPQLLKGQGAFVDDIPLANALHVAFVRSPYARARINAIDVSAARAHPGVAAVYTADDIGALDREMPLLIPHPSMKDARTQRPLARGEVYYVGQTVAMVVAVHRRPPEHAPLGRHLAQHRVEPGLDPEHPLVPALTKPEQRDAVEAYRRKAAGKSDLERTDLAKEKSGVFTGSYAINPVNGARIPVWVADYVLMGYGTGAIMAVPAHDERDWEFAQLYRLPTPRVIAAADGSEHLPYVGDGTVINSPGYDGLPWPEAKKKITADLAAKGLGKSTVNYKLRDWLFSRQRYWGEPFPIVWVSEADYRQAAALRSDLPAQPVTFTENGVTQYALPLPDAALPLVLPDVQSYLPSGTGESPLANEKDWLEIWFNVATGAAVPDQNWPCSVGASAK